LLLWLSGQVDEEGVLRLLPENDESPPAAGLPDDGAAGFEPATSRV
jgi:hypothetical protein